MVHWQTDRTSAAAVVAGRERWPTSSTVFRQAFLTSLAEHSIRAWPFGDEAAEIGAVPLQAVRVASFAIYLADGDDQAKGAEVEREASKWAVEACLGRSLIGSVAPTVSTTSGLSSRRNEPIDRADRTDP